MWFLKRFLPFALALTVGVMLWLVFGQTPRMTCKLSTNDGDIDTGSGGALVGRTADGELNYDQPFNPRDVDRKARILWRLEPQYPEEAIVNRVEGTVVVLGVVTKNGWVERLRVMSNSPDDLIYKALEATGQMKFSPAMKDGHPVAQYIQIEYNFKL